MIKRYCVKKEPSKDDLDIVEALMGAVHGLLNSISGVKAVSDYPDSGVAFLYVFLLGCGSLAHGAVTKLMFLYSRCQNEEIIDYWVDTYTKEHNDHTRFESLISVFDHSEDSLYILSFIQAMNVLIGGHCGLYKRMTVSIISCFDE